jgi:hydroxyethylthiazole kinase-like uncharacterized protein yjeF
MMKARLVDAALLRGLPLPQAAEGSKEERGRMCIIGGSREVPGAVLLAGLGAMRAGLGKLQIVTAESRAGALAVAMPEALVIGVPETRDGGLQCGALMSIASRFGSSDALLVGPGMVEERDGHEILKCVLDSNRNAVVVADAGSLPGLMDLGERLRERPGRVIVTPHAGEMANLLKVDKKVVEADPASAALGLTAEFGLVVVMKGSSTIITAPDGIWLYEGGGVGLATSGSGDVLAGIIAGLAARGAVPTAAALWGVYLHGEAGGRLSQIIGPLGFLAREIPDMIPKLLIQMQ